jgi:uncharacterized protein (TIGR04255 family)
MGHTDPFSGPAPQSIPLSAAPLSGVLAQIRFEEIFSIVKKGYVSDFQDRIRRQYPNHRREENVVVSLSAKEPEPKTETHWRFTDSDQNWRISLTTTFLALQCKRYSSRNEFMERLTDLLEALKETIGPSYCRRVGVRYVDRVQNEPFDRLGELVRPELLSFDTKPEYRPRILQSIHESICEIDEGKMIIRWGLIPENSTHAPDLMPPVNKKSWMLDVDAFHEFGNASVPFEVPMIISVIRGCADRTYSFFRWAVKDEFLRVHGGEL